MKQCRMLVSQLKIIRYFFYPENVFILFFTYFVCLKFKKLEKL